MSTGGIESGALLYRHLRLALRRLAQSFLSRETAEGEMAGVLFAAVLHGGAKQQLLPAAFGGSLYQVARFIASRFYVRDKGKPVYHTYQEAERLRRSGRELYVKGKVLKGQRGAAPVPTAAQHSPGRRDTG